MSEPTLELAERALGHARGDAQATVSRERSLVSRFARSRPTQATRVEDTTVAGLRVVRGPPGSAEDKALSDSGLADVAARADAAARAAARAAAEAGEDPRLPEPGPARAPGGVGPSTA